MKSQSLEASINIARKIGHIFIATADAVGMPHIAAAGKMESAGAESLAITEWFCPGTLKNLSENKSVSITVWDKDSDNGYQILGYVEKIQDMAIMDGYSKKMENNPPLPQVERRLIVRIEKIIDFKLKPHTDLEI
jgi:hypothetical protein